MTTELDRQFVAGPEAAREARHVVDGLGDELPARVLDDLRLLVSELVTNSVRHAHLEGDSSIGLHISVGPRTVRVEVSDPGPGFVRREVSPSLYQTSGWGLYFVGEIADRWGVFHDLETHVWFEMDREARGEPTRAAG